jgi:hypothetical protein
METKTKQSEVFNRANELSLLQTRNLVNTLIRYNDNLMEYCDENYNIKECKTLTDTEKNLIYHRIVNEVQERTFEISTILELIKKQYGEIEYFLENDLYDLKFD